ncbi:hypothetical protein SAY87_022539 [Trapa incisa]|uniref:DUF7866 domain-containing protein n=1 Tax=Trapa incisa TaxID=236973 RepID=A0AAN7Q4V1_9MYRT|nr:hypothetical protein SAY87_022539 [Trapa incisa]
MAAADHIVNLAAFLFISIMIIDLIPAATQVNWMPADQHVSIEPASFPIPKAGWSGGTRKQQAPFRICSNCTCCKAASPKSICASMPCCYVIDCNIPNKPSGVCALLPKTCNCNSCAA